MTERPTDPIEMDFSRLAYGVGHDLKAPLASVIGLLRFCTEDLQDGNLEDLKQNLARALDLCHRGAARVDGLLEYSRAGQADVQVGIVVVSDLVQDIWEQLTLGLETGAELSVDYHHKDPIISDPIAIQLIVSNLLSNAVRFKDEEKSALHVTVATAHVNQMLHLTVTDNGVGIPEDRQADVFQLFRRIHQCSGNGLGLALIKRRLEQLGGIIAFESKSGRGTSFKVQIPVARESSL